MEHVKDMILINLALNYQANNKKSKLSKKTKKEKGVEKEKEKKRHK